MIVLDASAAVDALFYPAVFRKLLDFPGTEDWHAVPGIIGLEVVSAIRRKERAGELTVARAEQALTDFEAFNFLRFDAHELIWPAWRLRYNITPYDAAYVALADLFGLTLVTQDEKLARAVRSIIDVTVLGD